MANFEAKLKDIGFKASAFVDYGLCVRAVLCVSFKGSLMK
jgi:hypothetical protein